MILFQGAATSMIEESLKAAPSLAVAIGGIYFVARLFTQTWTRNEETRVQTMDERHATYFNQLRDMQESHTKNTHAIVQAMDRGTEALKESNALHASVREILRDPKFASQRRGEA